jgi:hypothetical protein
MRKQASSSSLVTLVFHSCFILRLRESCNRKDLTIFHTLFKLVFGRAKMEMKKMRCVDLRNRSGFHE